MIEWVATGISFIGAFLITKGDPKMMPAGFMFYITASSCWLTYAIMTGQIPLALTNIMFMTMEIRGLILWQRKKN